MPKIIVKNIPITTSNKICARRVDCPGCPLYDSKKSDYCMRGLGYTQKDTTIVDLADEDFPTNREWLESLSDEDLAAFYTQGLLIEKYSPFPINIHQTLGSFMSSQQGIKDWLSKPCLYLMEDDNG